MKQIRRNIPLLITGVVVTLILGSRYIATPLSDRTGRVDPQIILSPNDPQQIRERQRRQQMQAFISVVEGEVSRTEERIREATALALATSLFTAKASLAQRIPPGVEHVLAGVKSAGLLPPGMRLSDRAGSVSSLRSELRVRYRPEPLGIEIISVGKERIDGPVMVLRTFPSNSRSNSSADAIQLCLATRLDDIAIPRPFASEAEIITLGFVPEPLRALALPNFRTDK